jgi:hypothetical protein
MGRVHRVARQARPAAARGVYPVSAEADTRVSDRRAAWPQLAGVSLRFTSQDRWDA